MINLISFSKTYNQERLCKFMDSQGQVPKNVWEIFPDKCIGVAICFK